MERSAAAGVTGSTHGFPVTLTSFVGRAQAVDEVAGQLGQHRLVTVTGPGGAGKTRLAGEVARQVAVRFADGVWLAELAAVRDPVQVAAVVAAALGIRDLPPVAPADALARALARRQLLLVLDNCEQVIGAAAELCGRLLLGADDVRVLATSREPLRIAGEVRYRLGPLTLPDPDDLAAARDCAAVTLFADRARRVQPGFGLDETAAATVGRLVARLDGMPLAIELAAARVDTVGVPQLLDRIDDRFALLADGDRLAEARQRSLAAAVQWSYELLDEPERRVFRAVSAFPGPFTLDGAEAVAGPGTAHTVLRLVDCSLLVPPQVDPDGRSRYQMLETLRAYGTGLLAEAGEDGAVTAALAGYAAGIAEQAAIGLLSRSAELAGVRRLDAEAATVRHALAWAVQNDAAMAQRLVLAQAPWWQMRGRLTSHAAQLAAVAEHAGAGSDEWCGARLWLGQAAILADDPQGALEHFTAVRDALERADGSRSPSGPVLLALALSGRSGTQLYLGRAAEAAEDGRQSLARARQTGSLGLEAVALACLSSAAWHDGDRDRAVQLARQARQIPDEFAGTLYRALGQIVTMALAEDGDLAGAEQACAAAVTACRDAGDLTNLSVQLCDHGDPRSTGRPCRRRSRASARATPDHHADRAARHPVRRAGLLRPPVRRDRAPGRCGHGVGGDVRAGLPLAIPARITGPGRAGGSPAPRPAAARAGRSAGGAGAWHRHEPGRRHRVRAHARGGGAVSGGRRGHGSGPGQAQPEGAGTGHPGRAGPHRRADRRPAVHHRAHGRLAPGPDQGQDRLPAPRRPHPARAQRRPDQPGPRRCG